MSFQLEADLFHGSLDLKRSEGAVFVLGLARSGTTILLQALHRAGCFESLTYRDMPFVLMPRTWARISAISQVEMDAQERAHGDSIKIDFNSPEAFEEVFWQTFAAHQDPRAAFLIPEELNDEEIRLFRRYVAGIASMRSEPKRRYLSKNNNNVLRLPGLRRALPDAAFLLLFRDPLQTARSLLSQHRRFCASQRRDPFQLEYMNWLGHFEFGLGHRPFCPSESTELLSLSPEQPDYWLTYWIDVYEYVLGLDSTNHVLVNYDALCARPMQGLQSIGEVINCEADWEAIGATLRQSFQVNLPEFSQSLIDRALGVYGRLQQAAL